MSISLDSLPDELICRVLYHWLYTSDAPMTLRHCAAKYFDRQHQLDGYLSRCAIRKISPYHRFYTKSLEINRPTYGFDEDMGDIEGVETTTLMLPIRKRRSKDSWDVKYYVLETEAVLFHPEDEPPTPMVDCRLHLVRRVRCGTRKKCFRRSYEMCRALIHYGWERHVPEKWVKRYVSNQKVHPLSTPFDSMSIEKVSYFQCHDGHLVYGHQYYRNA